MLNRFHCIHLILRVVLRAEHSCLISSSSSTSTSAKSSNSSSTTTSTSSRCSQTLNHVPEIVIVMRHGERVDDQFPKWFKKCYKKGDIRCSTEICLLRCHKSLRMSTQEISSAVSSVPGFSKSTDAESSSSCSSDSSNSAKSGSDPLKRTQRLPLLHRISNRLPEIFIVMRHGERVDDLFPKWVKKCFNEGGYTVLVGNMPLALPQLGRQLEDFKHDTPLSYMGDIMARLVGQGLMVDDLTPDAVYCSPSLRCVQIAASVRSSPLASCRMNVEPGLFQTNKKDRKLTFLPHIPVEEIGVLGEEALAYNKRIHGTFDEILIRAGNESQRIVLIVGHASTVDLAMGYFAYPRQMDFHFQRIGNKIPYCSAVVFRRLQCSQCSLYEYGSRVACRPPADQCCQMMLFAETSLLPPITYTNFSSRIDSKFLLSTNEKNKRTGGSRRTSSFRKTIKQKLLKFLRIKLPKINKEGGSSYCNCSKPGHMSCECPQPRNGGGGGRRCYKCQETVHMSRECSHCQR
uniref:CCHC-type domain-containing protein n=1 Tax=Ditylenchus dipsaci TaxID=166011 RepID=A0A915EFQ7_9BILA